MAIGKQGGILKQGVCLQEVGKGNFGMGFIPPAHGIPRLLEERVNLLRR
jgi:hypothetical protein